MILQFILQFDMRQSTVHTISSVPLRLLCYRSKAF